MAKYIMEPSRTLGEFLLLPNLTTRDCIPGNVSLKTPLVKFRKGEQSAIVLNSPFTSASMQSVSGEKMAAALASEGGVAFIFCSQTVEDQAAMVAAAKKSKVKVEQENKLVDTNGKYVVGAAVNTRDYKERIPALIKAGADVLCIDSSDGYSEWQKDVIDFVRQNYGDKVKIGAGNVVDSYGFNYLADAGADFIKVGIGGGSICITREQKGIGRGQASALIDVADARDKYFKKTKTYIPICSDGGMNYEHQMILSFAMGADFIMGGRFFARFEESPSKKVTINDKVCKEYWGEGSNRARNWQRYDSGGNKKLMFEEGVDSYIPFAGKLSDNLAQTIYKIKSTMCNCGSLDLPSFRRDARLTVVSNASLVEGGAHDVAVKS